MNSKMPRQRSRTYLLQRAVDERHAAQRATCEEARLAHRELARCYAAEAREGHLAPTPASRLIPSL
jgi:hypothetical protein